MTSQAINASKTQNIDVHKGTIATLNTFFNSYSQVVKTQPFSQDVPK